MERLTAYLLGFWLDRMADRVRGVKDIAKRKEQEPVDYEVDKIVRYIDELGAKLFEVAFKEDP